MVVGIITVEFNTQLKTQVIKDILSDFYKTNEKEIEHMTWRELKDEQMLTDVINIVGV